VREDDVRAKALPAKLRGARGDAAAALDRALHRRAEALRPEAGRHFVAIELHARDARRAAEVGPFADGEDLVAVAHVIRREMPVLAREVLVDEEEAHHNG